MKNTDRNNFPLSWACMCGLLMRNLVSISSISPGTSTSASTSTSSGRTGTSITSTTSFEEEEERGAKTLLPRQKTPLPPTQPL